MFTVNRKQVLNFVKAVDSRPTKYLPENELYFISRNNSLYLQSIKLNPTIQIMELKVDWTGKNLPDSFSVDRSMFKKILSTIKDEFIGIEFDQYNVKINEMVIVKGFQEHVDFPGINQDLKYILTPFEFEKLADYNSHFPFDKTYEKRPHVLCNFFCINEKEEIEVHGTNSKCAFIQKMLNGNNVHEKFWFSIDKGDVQKISKVFKKEKWFYMGIESPLNMGEQWIIFGKDELQMAVKAVIYFDTPENYPVEVVYNLSNTEKKKSFTVNRENFINQIEKLQIYKGKNGSIYMETFIDSIELTAINPEIGETKIVLQAEASGPIGKIAINPDYFMMLKNGFKKDVTFHMSEKDQPIVFKFEGNTFIVMPMRMN